MRFGMILFIAAKNLWYRKMSSLLTFVGIGVGIGMIIFLVSLGYGLEKVVTSQVTDMNAFKIIDVNTTDNNSISIDKTAMDKIKTFGHVVGAAPVITLAGRISDSNSSAAEVIVTATDDDYWKMDPIKPSLGSLPTQTKEVMVNKKVLDMLDSSLDGNYKKMLNQTVTLQLIIPGRLQVTNSKTSVVWGDLPYKIVGISDEDSASIYIFRDELVNANIQKYTSIKVKVDTDLKSVTDGVRAQIKTLGFGTDYIGDTISQVKQVFTFFRAILVIFGLIALLVAMIGTFNTLTVSLLERLREIGLFKALGMCNRNIYQLFLAEALIFGTFGGILGLFFGYIASGGVNVLFRILASRAGVDAVQLFSTPWQLTLEIVILSAVVGLLTGIYPSIKAAKTDPLDALRYE